MGERTVGLKFNDTRHATGNLALFVGKRGLERAGRRLEVEEGERLDREGEHAGVDQGQDGYGGDRLGDAGDAEERVGEDRVAPVDVAEAVAAVQDQAAILGDGELGTRDPQVAISSATA